MEFFENQKPLSINFDENLDKAQISPNGFREYDASYSLNPFGDIWALSKFSSKFIERGFWFSKNSIFFLLCDIEYTIVLMLVHVKWITGNKVKALTVPATVTLEFK